MAHAAGIKLKLDDWTRIGKKVPVLADLKPSGKHVMWELVQIGGIMPLMKTLLEEGLLHGDCLTVSGKTLKENLAGVKQYPKGSDDHPGFRRSNQTEQPFGHTLWEPGPGRRRGQDLRKGRTSVSRGRREFSNLKKKRSERSWTTKSRKETSIVIRYEGPKGGPGMREMLAPTSAIVGKGLGKDVALDHRREIFRRQSRICYWARDPGGVYRRADRDHQEW